MRALLNHTKAVGFCHATCCSSHFGYNGKHSQSSATSSLPAFWLWRFFSLEALPGTDSQVCSLHACVCCYSPRPVPLRTQVLWQKLVQLPLQSPLLCLLNGKATTEAWEHSLLACWAREVGLSCTWISQYLLPSWLGTAPAPPAGWASSLHLITFAQPCRFKRWRQSW